ncbi:MAG: carbon-nitrogen hydrolase family protein [Thermodesulfobacteriota bacterium]
MKIALAQSVISSEIEENLQKSLDCMDIASSKGADLICFPEVQFSPFFPQFPGKDASEYAMEIDHKIVKQLQAKCRELNLICVPNFYLKQGHNHYDASPLINSNGSISKISKMVHIAQFPCFFEQDYYTPSDDGFIVYDTPFGKIGIVICFDRHIPESIRTCVLKGAQLIIIPTVNTKAEPLEMFEWELRVPAMQNSVFIAMCNRVGKEADMDFCGESLVVGPDGGVIAKADDTEQILYADIDFSMIDINRKKNQYLSLRRPEFYQN